MSVAPPLSSTPLASNAKVSAQADPEGYFHVVYSNGSHLTYLQVKPDVHLRTDDSKQISQHIGTLVEKCMDYEQLRSNLQSSTRVNISWFSDGLGKAMVKAQAIGDCIKSIEIDDGAHEYLSTPIRDIVRDCITRSCSLGAIKQQAVYQPSLRDKSVSFEYEHTALGKVYGKEKATMHPMVESFIRNTQGTLISLEKALQECSDNQMANCYQRQIEFLSKKIEMAKTYQLSTNSALIDSSYYRKILKSIKKEILASSDERLKEGGKLNQQGWNAVHQRASDAYIPFLTNCWRQSTASVTDDGHTEWSWMRFGAFYDSRSSTFALNEFMTVLEPNPADGNRVRMVDASDEEVEKKAKELLLRLENYKMSSSDQEKMAQLGAINYVKSRICKSDNEIDIQGVRDWLAERKIIMQTSFLSLLEAQAQNLKDGAEGIKWAHLSLIKPHEDKIQGEEAGWSHSEKYELQELKWAFDYFRGARVIFADVQTPSVDYDEYGQPETITLSRSLVEGKKLKEVLPLECHLVSTSVASTTIRSAGAVDKQAEDLQKEINSGFFNSEKVPDSVLDPSEPSFKDLQMGRSSYYTAEDLAVELILNGWCLSGACQSGKDRTGYWCSRLAQRLIVSRLDQAKEQGKISNIGYWAARRLLNGSAFNGMRVSKQILKSNTGYEALKTAVFNLPGQDELYLSRFCHYIDFMIDKSGARTIMQKVCNFVDKKFIM